MLRTGELLPIGFRVQGAETDEVTCNVYVCMLVCIDAVELRVVVDLRSCLLLEQKANREISRSVVLGVSRLVGWLVLASKFWKIRLLSRIIRHSQRLSMLREKQTTRLEF